MNTNANKKHIIIIIIATALVHSLLIVFFTIDISATMIIGEHSRQPSIEFYEEPTANQALSSTVPTIDSQQEKPTVQPKEELEEWGNLKAGASNLNVMPEDSENYEISSAAQDSNTQESDIPSTQDFDSVDSDIPPESPENKAVTKINEQPEEGNRIDSTGISLIGTIKPQDTAQITEKKIKKRKNAASSALASITKGYLNQLDNGGSDLLNSIGGDLNKRPTALQLQYERYFSKIFWHIQNAMSIESKTQSLNMKTFQPLYISFVLQRNGTVDNLHIQQSSRNITLDTFFKKVISEAGKSFPSLPPFIKTDQFPIIFIIDADEYHYHISASFS